MISSQLNLVQTNTGAFKEKKPRSDIRIVASMASMLEEPYWRIEEPNPLMAKWSEVRK